MPEFSPPPLPRACRKCGTEIGGALIVCPACSALLYADELQRLAQVAADAKSPGDALAAWREALKLLPADSRQYQTIVGKIDELRQQADRGTGARVSPPAAPQGNAGRRTGLAGAAAAAIAMLAKFKVAIFFALTKLKFLLLGLSKMGTLFSMLASFGIYWTLWGWKFAAGLVGSIYIHEMGHVARLRQYGIKATAPMFIPGVGALIRMKERLPTAIEEARVGLAGPIWGCGAALACWAVGLATGGRYWFVISGVGAWMNIFNLIPVWQLDGSHAFCALGRRDRWLACAVAASAFFITHDGLLAIVAIVAGVRAFGPDAPEKSDARTLLEYVGLIAVLSTMVHFREGV